MKGITLLFVFILGVYALNAQHFIVKERESGRNYTNDTISLQLIDNGFQGWQSLNVELLITNTGSTTRILGARKAEYDTIRDASHSFCFGGNCFDEKTWDSPLHDTLKAGATDSSFSGHLIFDNRVHSPKVNLVAYVFYDVNNPADSSAVYLRYDSHPLAGFTTTKNAYRNQGYPNPAGDVFILPNTSDIVHAYNALGQTMPCAIEFKDDAAYINTTALPNGTYWYQNESKANGMQTGRFAVVH